MRPGISCSAKSSSLRPNSARPISLTFESAMAAKALRLTGGAYGCLTSEAEMAARTGFAT
eukprot:8288869-Alexandrium_andersonii.AAC.1